MIWPLRPVSDLCEFAYDCVNKTAPAVDYETPFKMIRTTNVKGGFIYLDEVKYVTEDTFEKWTRRSRPQYGDVILTREAPVGEVGRCTFDQTKSIFLGQRLFHYRPDPKMLDWNFLAYVLQSPFVQNKLQGMGFGATVAHIKVGDAEHLAIPCPGLDIQRQVGSTLANYDDLIETNRRRIALLEESARLLYREWFVKLRFPGHELVEKVDGVPAGWKRQTLKQIAFLNYGKALKESERKEGEVPVYGSSGIVGRHNKALVPGPSIILGRKGNVGSVYFSRNACHPIDTVYFISNQQTTYYLYLLLQTMNFISSDAAVPGLNREYAHGLPVLCPSPSILSRFEAEVDSLFQQAETLQRMNNLAAQARDALLPKLMSGQLTV